MTAAHIADHVVVILPFGAGAWFGYFTKQQVSHRHLPLPHSSSASRFTAGAAGFFILSQSGERPER
jgi:hypothetical protein